MSKSKTQEYVVLSGSVQGLAKGDVVKLTDEQARKLVNCVRLRDDVASVRSPGEAKLTKRVAQLEEQLEGANAQVAALTEALAAAGAPAVPPAT